jgi:hypothetical protein
LECATCELHSSSKYIKLIGIKFGFESKIL